MAAHLLPCISLRGQPTAVLRTSEGTLPLSCLLGRTWCSEDQDFLHQECSTLVALINRHLDLKVSHAATNLDYPEAMKFSTEPSLGDGNVQSRTGSKESAVHARGKHSLASLIRLTTVKVGQNPYSTGCCTDDSIHLQFLRSCGMFGCFMAFLCVFIAELCAISAFEASFPAARGSCMQTIVFDSILFSFALLFLLCLSVVLRMKTIVSVEVSASGEFWKVHRALACPPLRDWSLWSHQPLSMYVTRWTTVVAEGSLEQLRGCEVCFCAPEYFIGFEY